MPAKKNAPATSTRKPKKDRMSTAERDLIAQIDKARESENDELVSSLTKRLRTIQFKRLASQRVTQAINKVRLVKNVARYPHDPADGAKILDALRKAVEEVEFSFQSGPTAAKETFSL